MIDFMVITAPRSASTWTANWLTTDTTLCMHEPSWKMDCSAFDSIESEKMLGLSETGSIGFHKWAKQHPARKVILHRDIDECSASLQALGFPPLSDYWRTALDGIEGRHYHWQDVWDEAKAKDIYEFLLQREFDAERWRWIKEIEMQPHFAGLTINKGVAARLLKEMRDTQLDGGTAP